MKNKINYLPLILILILFSYCSKKNASIQRTTIEFANNIHDFGSIKSKQYANAIFSFSNSGNNPLIITDVKTTCGCTVPEYPKEPLLPNEKGEIKVIYDAKYPGRFNKTITVFYNGKDSPKTLAIKGEVAYPKEFDTFVN
ncbi:DUF1573 domain-containing protein [Aureibaculum sp. 2210JD6-5]|uniref:DUF1573 domain-containing protein n=1 Tax=Aureibaculum sp. 2210JD6-5 TaxID=3103957 RepID=UPI002AAD64C6|nr:DUF1573 domain-containing protein [Aureibaculum sp. 2210JD6-5]MDY7396730.1 DUF1573 domain-containing protein [Aureibaculum sp. 2210JD6-5]